MQEGNVLTGVCLSFSWGPHVTIIHDALELTVQAPLQTWGMRTLGSHPEMGHGDSHLASDIWWPSLETCSNLFIGPHCSGSPSPCYWHLVATEARMVGKQAVCILLECFLVDMCLLQTAVDLSKKIELISIGRPFKNCFYSKTFLTKFDMHLCYT